jgi:hypothetical protein
MKGHQDTDCFLPTPEEIAKRAAIERAAHFAKRRGERGPQVRPGPPAITEVRVDEIQIEEL